MARVPGYEEVKDSRVGGFYTQLAFTPDPLDDEIVFFKTKKKGMYLQRVPPKYSVYLMPAEVAEKRKYPPGRASYSAFPGSED